MNRALIIVPIVVVVLIVIIVSFGTFYIVDESQQVVITQFGKIIGEPITEPGLHTKMPFVQEANYFSKRLLDWEGEKTVIKTIEQKFIYVEVYARWRIADAKLYRQTLRGSFETASSRLDGTINPIVKDVIANFVLRELVRSDTDRVIYERVLKGTVRASEKVQAVEVGSAEQPEEQGGEAREQEVPEDEAGEVQDLFKSIDQQEEEMFELLAWRIEKGRQFITRQIFEKANAQMTSLGIELADVRILRINYQPVTRQQVYNRMIAERQRVTARYISEGEQKSAELIGTKDRLVKEIQSKAREQELKILGEGEAQAIKIYADAYNRDVSFYNFYKTLETLRNTADKETWLILSTDSDLYRILKNIGALRR